MKPGVRTDHGYTLIEVTIVIAIASVLGLALISTVQSSQRAIQITSVQSDLEVQAQQIVEQIAKDLIDSGPSVMTPGFGSTAWPTSTLSFRRCAGYGRYTGETNAVAVHILWSPQGGVWTYTTNSVVRTVNGVPTTIYYIDLINTATGQTRTLTDLAVANGLSFNKVGSDRIRVSLTLQKTYHRDDSPQADANGNLTYTATAQTIVQLHNP